MLISRLVLRSVSLQRGERVLFEGLDFEACAGDAVALVGANGVGKTSLLRAMAGLIRPIAGDIFFEGPEGPLEPTEARRCGCHYIGHQDGLKPARTAGDELVFQVLWSGGEVRAALDAAAKLGISRTLDLEVRRLSAGQRRRLALARLIAVRRSLWLLDEPLAPLDKSSRDLLGEIMVAHLGNGGLIVAAVHDPLPIAARQLALGQ